MKVEARLEAIAREIRDQYSDRDLERRLREIVRFLQDEWLVRVGGPFVSFSFSAEKLTGDPFWPRRCICESPKPQKPTPEPDFAWCQCGGYVRVSE